MDQSISNTRLDLINFLSSNISECVIWNMYDEPLSQTKVNLRLSLLNDETQILV